MGSGQVASGEGRMREPVRSYRDLEVSALGMDIAESCYTLTRSFPQDERFGLMSQMRRAAVSVPCNIAKGWGRDNRGDYIHMLRIAQGSLKELETQALLAQRLDYLTDDDSNRLLHIDRQCGSYAQSADPLAGRLLTLTPLATAHWPPGPRINHAHRRPVRAHPHRRKAAHRRP